MAGGWFPLLPYRFSLTVDAGNERLVEERGSFPKSLVSGASSELKALYVSSLVRRFLL